MGNANVKVIELSDELELAGCRCCDAKGWGSGLSDATVSRDMVAVAKGVLEGLLVEWFNGGRVTTGRGLDCLGRKHATRKEVSNNAMERSRLVLFVWLLMMGRAG